MFIDPPFGVFGEILPELLNDISRSRDMKTKTRKPTNLRINLYIVTVLFFLIYDCCTLWIIEGNIPPD